MWGWGKKDASCWFIMEKVTDPKPPCTTWTGSQTYTQACFAEGFSLALSTVNPGTHMQRHTHTCAHTLAPWCRCNNIRVGGDFKGVTNVWLRLSLPLSPAGSFDSLHPSHSPSLHYPSTFQPVCPCTSMTPLLHPARNLPFTLLRSLWTQQHLQLLERLRGCAVSQSETSVGCVCNAVPWAPCVVSWPGMAQPCLAWCTALSCTSV